MIRVLLDENLARKLKQSLNADTITVPECGWGGIKNGQLLRKAAAEFDVMLTMDRGIEHQQNLSDLNLCLIVLSAVSNDLDDLLPLVPSINIALTNVSPGHIIHIREYRTSNEPRAGALTSLYWSVWVLILGRFFLQ